MSKPVPVMVTVESGTCVVGEKLVMVGAAGGEATVNDADVVIEPAGDVLEIVIATEPLTPDGTGTTIAFAVTDVGVAVIVPNFTVVVPPVKAVPEIVTEVPTGPLDGKNCTTPMVVDGVRLIDVMLPAAS
jgi:hypothetical protein